MLTRSAARSPQDARRLPWSGVPWLAVLATLLAACAQPGGSPKPPPVAAGAVPTQTGSAAATTLPTPATGSAPVPAAAAAVRPTPQPPGAGGPAPSTAAPPGSPPPFATVIKDATRSAGFIATWRKDERLWLELLPSQLGQPLLLVPKVSRGVGEGQVLGGLLSFPANGVGGPQLVEFQRVHNQVRLVARNLDVQARAGSPLAHAVRAAYSDSLLTATAVASQPHPESKAILIDGSALFLTDLAGIGAQLQRSFRLGYQADRGNSVVTAVRSGPDSLVVETQTHYFSGSAASAAPGPLGPLLQPAPSVPRWLPDARSMLVGQHFSLTALPAQAMRERRADARVGLFSSTRLDFSDDLARSPRQRFIHRWRLEKQDPAAPMSPPVRPITFWMDRSVPHEYRDAVQAGVLEWNKAFERIGFRDALVVRRQADDAEFDTLDHGVASIRWLVNADNWFSGIGQTVIDPRSGEILDAKVALESMAFRAQRYARSQLLAAAAAPLPELAATAPASPAILPEQARPAGFAAPLPWPQGRWPWTPPAPAGSPTAPHALCLHGDALAEQAAYATDVMQARGMAGSDDAAARQFVLDYVKDTVMHEVGHALGLRHNFRASRAYTEQQLSDPEFTRVHGTTGSVMDYNAVNLPRPGEPVPAPFQTTLGPYDYWAIEYAYKVLPTDGGAADEEAELQRIAARSAEPLLAFGTDEDVLAGLDAETLQLDLGADPVAFAARRLDIARDLFRRQEARHLAPEQDYAVLRRTLGYALADATRAIGVLARQFGGLRTLRDHPGSGRDPLQPVAADVQRRAYGLIADAVLAADGLRVTPGLQRRLAPDYLERGEFALPTDFQLPQRLLDLQRAVLAWLLSDSLAARMLEAHDKLDADDDRFGLPELYRRLSDDVWVDLDAGAGRSSGRREMQRDYVNRIASVLLRPSPLARADARSPLRHEAERLAQRIERRLGKGGLDEATRLHLLDSADSLRQALSARLPRQGV